MRAGPGNASIDVGEPCVSIIVPVYKVPEELLRRCIESILCQTLREIEIILVDDGSPDQCGSICDEYARTDSRIVPIHKENGGLSAARNTGQRVAKAPWIMFVDDDDWIESDMCERLHETATRDRVQLVMCGASKDYSNNREIYRFNLEEGKIYSGDECKELQVRLLKFEENIADAWAKLIDKSVLDEHGIEHDESLGTGAEGLEFNLRLFDCLQSAAFIKKPFYHYFYNNKSSSASHDEAHHRNVVSSFEKIKTLVEASNNSKQLLPWFRNRLLYVVITTAISGFFSPDNPAPYATKKLEYSRYLAIPIIDEALVNAGTASLSKQRKTILFLVHHRMFWALDLAGRIRYWQKQHR